MISTPRYRRRRAKRVLGLFITVFVMTMSLLFVIQTLHSHLSSKQKKLVLDASADQLTPTVSPSPSPSASPTPDSSNSPGLTTAVQGALIGTKGKYGIVVKNLKTGESYEQNEHTPFESASLYKLWIMAIVFSKLQDGSLHQNDVLQEDSSVLIKRFNLDPDSNEAGSGTVKFTVHDALYQMITISDNTAALILTEKIGLSSVTKFLQQKGFTESHVGINGGEPMTTASDVALFFDKLYNGQLGNATTTQQMVALLQQQKLNEKIPLYLPDSLTIAHKTGELDNDSHDAGIVYSPNGDYILVVLSESNNPPQAIERIAEVSKAVYNYFTLPNAGG